MKNRVIKEQQTEWKRHRWQRIKTKLLKRGLDAQYELVVKLPDRAHSWDVTLSLEETINEFMVSVDFLFFICIFIIFILHYHFYFVFFSPVERAGRRKYTELGLGSLFKVAPPWLRLLSQKIYPFSKIQGLPGPPCNPTLHVVALTVILVVF